MGDWLRELADARVTTADLEPDRETTNRRAAVGQAMRVRNEVAAFERRWPTPQQGEAVPAFTWSQLERQLADDNLLEGALVAQRDGSFAVVEDGALSPLDVPRTQAVELRALPFGYVFPGDQDGHLSPAWVGKLVARLIPDEHTMHALRHRFATRAYSFERDVLVVQELLGHASPVTTRRYVRVPSADLRRTVEAVGA